MPNDLAFALYLLVVAGGLALLNQRTTNSWFAKKLTYHGMWVCIFVSIYSASRIL